MVPCVNTIENSFFYGNAAEEEGGAIIYNTYQPKILNNTFQNNTAIFGEDVASYATRIKLVVNGTNLVDFVELNDVPSGIKIDSPIEVALVSAESDQIMTSNSGSTVKFYIFEDGTNARGQNTVTFKNGRATFINTIFVAKPGAKNVKFKISSSAINYKVLQYLDPVKYADQIISVNFRW
jgi:hypothetical protein